MWEDPYNVNGGKWVVSLPKNRKSLFEKYWVNSVMALPYNFEIAGRRRLPIMLSDLELHQRELQ